MDKHTNAYRYILERRSTNFAPYIVYIEIYKMVIKEGREYVARFV